MRWLLAAGAVRLAVGLTGPAVRGSALAGIVETAAGLVIAAVAGYLLLDVLVRLLRRLLWRVRRKLMLSYVFIGLTPIVLIVNLLLLTGILAELKGWSLTFARAGHTPLIHLARDGGATGARVLAPDGLAAGLDGFERQFEELLEEDTLAIGAGDLMALFTDGNTEAMNVDDEQFGEERLARLIEQHRDAGPDALGRQVPDSVGGFVGRAAQHDDMTIVLLRTDGGETG